MMLEYHNIPADSVERLDPGTSQDEVNGLGRAWLFRIDDILRNGRQGP